MKFLLLIKKKEIEGNYLEFRDETSSFIEEYVIMSDKGKLARISLDSIINIERLPK
jgi:hypothetical protein